MGVQIFISDFSHRVRREGQSYFVRGMVRLEDGDDSHIRSRVQGTDMYRVSISWDGELNYTCSCPYMRQHGQPCKHIWATLLAADAKNMLPSQMPSLVDDALDDDDDFSDRKSIPWRNTPAPPPQPRRHAIWRRQLSDARSFGAAPPIEEPPVWPPDKQVIFIADISIDTRASDGLWIELASQRISTNGKKPEYPKKLRLAPGQSMQFPDPTDRQLIGMLVGVGQEERFDYEYSTASHRRFLRSPNAATVLRDMCKTGRCRLRTQSAESDPPPLTWDEGDPWQFWLSVLPEKPGETYRLSGSLRRTSPQGEQRMDIRKPLHIVPGGPLFLEESAAALDDGGAYAFIRLLRGDGDVVIPAEQTDQLIDEILQFPRLPRLELCPEINVKQIDVPPKPKLKISPPPRGNAGDDKLRAALSFDYDQSHVPREMNGSAIFDPQTRQIIRRDIPAERAALQTLRDLGFRNPPQYDQSESLHLAPRRLPAAVAALADRQWRVEVDGKTYRRPGKIRMDVSSGIDWFELHGEVEFDGVAVPLPALLTAIRKGHNTILLDDGSLGIVPEEWLQRYGLLAAVGQLDEDSAKFKKHQAGLLDVLLADQPQVTFDAAFTEARKKVREFSGIAPVDAPAEFVGELRPYQRDGLGWLQFLRSFGLNGCLADDMGLGKTIQVLALLESRRVEGRGPSLVVVPRSLVFNWRMEAAKFTPKLRVLDHATADRRKETDHFSDYDVILITYGTLRNDAALLRQVHFDYLILDEAQAIKNAASESAKAARILIADHRLALSGTPVQNHLGELWSLLDFLNPGMLGASSAFNSIGKEGGLDADARKLLSAALRPVILRRTKEQVAVDLPEKTEQTIFCELEPPQRKLYDELKEHYRQSLLDRISREGLASSKIQVLEALLRLRQAACHPGLLDPTRLNFASAKLDTLIPRLAEVADEGHKAIVFSQFTSFLAIVRQRLDDQAIVYEYLDGKTRDRRSCVERFQNDPDCPIFLVSLKAGGIGLNLTAAQYVFLLDPWWNPAIEAQAIDRAHRIGQTQKVFAYRLIAKDTVEEKVLKLQQTKRDLADAIIHADNALVANMGREDLELLLS